MKRPFTLINAAMSADGKIAPASRTFVQFGGKHDRELLLRLRASADAVMCGARTVDLNPLKLGTGGPRYRKQRLENGLAEYHLRVVISGSGTVDPGAELFRHRFSPIVVLTSARISRARRKALQKVAADVAIFGDEELDFAKAMSWLSSHWNVRRLVCEGGGEVNNAMLRAGLIDEIYATLCPLIFGGRNAPTLADGEGILRMPDAIRLKLKSLNRIGEEVYLVYRVVKN